MFCPPIFELWSHPLELLKFFIMPLSSIFWNLASCPSLFLFFSSAFSVAFSALLLSSSSSSMLSNFYLFSFILCLSFFLFVSFPFFSLCLVKFPLLLLSSFSLLPSGKSLAFSYLLIIFPLSTCVLLDFCFLPLSTWINLSPSFDVISILLDLLFARNHIRTDQYRAMNLLLPFLIITYIITFIPYICSLLSPSFCFFFFSFSLSFYASSSRLYLAVVSLSGRLYPWPLPSCPLSGRPSICSGPSPLVCLL